MSAVTSRFTGLNGRPVDWASGMLAGLVAGAFAGVLLAWSRAPVIESVLPTIYGVEPPAVAAGWLIHATHSLLFGLAYAVLAVRLPAWTRAPLRGLGAGVLYGFGLWLVVAQVIVPFVVPALGYGAAPAFPYLSPIALVGFVGFGALVGLTYAVGVRAPDVGSATAPGG